MRRIPILLTTLCFANAATAVGGKKKNNKKKCKKNKPPLKCPKYTEAPTPEPSTSKFDVIVIGSGISGLSAATKLEEEGFVDVQVLEAMDRIGGRMHRKELSSTQSIDYGGQVSFYRL